MPLKVIFITPTRVKPHAAYLDSLERSVPLIIAAGYDEGYASEAGSPYISAARANCLKRALTAKGDIFVFLDDDLSWDPADLVTLVNTPGDVVGGTYRTKEEIDNYMGRVLQDEHGRPVNVRADGAIEAACLPGGFLKVTKEAVAKFMQGYPELCYGTPWDMAVDLFNHGAWKGLWWGEDYAFCRRWRDLGEQVWLVPNLNINHHSWTDDRVWKGNFHEYLMRRPGGKLSDISMEDVVNGRYKVED